MATFNSPNRVKITNPYPNVDFQYGPWSSVAAAASSVVPESIRQIGLTVGVLTSGSVVEYWWEANTTDGGLVPKKAITTGNIAASSITTSNLDDSAVTTDKIANSNVTFAKLADLPGPSVIGNPESSTVTPQAVTIAGDFTTPSSNSLVNQQAIQTYVDTNRDRYNVQTVTLASTSASADSLTIAATTDIVRVVRSTDWEPTSITGFTENKPITFQFTTGTPSAFPYQVTFPSTIKTNDGVTPVLKNNSSSTYDELVIKGLSDSASGQIIGDITYGS